MVLNFYLFHTLIIHPQLVTQVGRSWNQILLELGAWHSFGRTLETELASHCHQD